MIYEIGMEAEHALKYFSDMGDDLRMAITFLLSYPDTRSSH